MILNQFDQVVAENHFAWRDRHITAHYELFTLNIQVFTGHGGFHVGHEVGPAAYQILAAFLQGSLEYFGVGQRRVRRREHIENLPGYERDDSFVLFVDTSVTGRRVVPPLLSEQERLINQIVRPLFPTFVIETMVLGQGFDTGWRIRILA